VISTIKKRDGRIVKFDEEKIENAIWRALKESGFKGNQSVARQLTEVAVSAIGKEVKEPDVERVQDFVEQTLMEAGYAAVAKAYILYRQKRAEVRIEKKKLLEKDEIDEVDKILDLNSLKVLKARYLKKNRDGTLDETPKELFSRVAIHVTLPELLYDEKTFSKDSDQTVWPTEDFDAETSNGKYLIGEFKLNQYHMEGLRRLYERLNRDKQMKLPWTKILEMLSDGRFNDHENTIKEFNDLMIARQFLPNTPAIANFGKPLGMGSACFVMDIEDSMTSIMDTLRNAAMVFKAGGGVGYNFSKLRPEGDFVSTTHGIASGPVSFIRLFDSMTDVIKQGGIRRGANMGIININHPDIEHFITSKEGNKGLRNFNISVLIMPDFWEHYEKNTPYPLRNPRSGKVVRTVNPRMLFDRIVYQAWESAEPGIIFFDHVNKYNPLYKGLGPIVTTNPCGEVLLYPNESCNLGSINVWSFCTEKDGKKTVDWDGLETAIWSATKFLDNVIDINKYPLKEVEDMTLATRKIGLGIMGLGDLLYELSVPYNTEDGRTLMGKMMEFINYHSKLASIQLARERGSFPYIDKSFFTDGTLPFSGFEDRSLWNFDWDSISETIKKEGLRNSYTTIIAPTGSISMIAGCSSGMEPVYSLVFEKNVKVGNFFYVDPVFEKVMASEGMMDEALMKDIKKNGGSIQKISYIPNNMKEVFITAMDIGVEDHIKALATLQKWVDSSISKTINFPASATVDQMRESYLLAYKLGCKNVSVYRDTSITDQVLVTSTEEPPESIPKKEIPISMTTTSDSTSSLPDFGEKINECPQCSSQVVAVEGCASCQSCGWGNCSI